jgi:hypothetical protein
MQQEFTFCNWLLQNLHDRVVDPLLLFLTDFIVVVTSVCKMEGWGCTIQDATQTTAVYASMQATSV